MQARMLLIRTQLFAALIFFAPIITPPGLFHKDDNPHLLYEYSVPGAVGFQGFFLPSVLKPDLPCAVDRWNGLYHNK